MWGCIDPSDVRASRNSVKSESVFLHFLFSAFSSEAVRTGLGVAVGRGT